MTTPSIDNRRFPRTRVLLSGRLFRGGKAVDCVITDLSAGGASIAAQRPLAGEGPAALSIDRYGVFPAELLWHAGPKAGIRFAEAPGTIAGALFPTLPRGRSVAAV